LHNVVSYLLYLIFARWFYLWYNAYKGDEKFFPSEKDLMTILFLPAEYYWRESKRRGIAVYDEPLWQYWRAEFWAQWIAAFRIRMYCWQGSIQALKGVDMFLSLEVQELRLMRSGKRSLVYEHFFATLEDRDAPPPPAIPEIPIFEPPRTCRFTYEKPHKRHVGCYGRCQDG